MAPSRGRAGGDGAGREDPAMAAGFVAGSDDDGAEAAGASRSAAEAPEPARTPTPETPSPDGKPRDASHGSGTPPRGMDAEALGAGVPPRGCASDVDDRGRPREDLEAAGSDDDGNRLEDSDSADQQSVGASSSQGLPLYSIDDGTVEPPSPPWPPQYGDDGGRDRDRARRRRREKRVMTSLYVR